MIDVNDRLLSEFSCLDPVYVEDCPFVLSTGGNVHLHFSRVVPKVVDNGRVVFEKVPALLLGNAVVGEFLSHLRKVIRGCQNAGAADRAHQRATMMR